MSHAFISIDELAELRRSIEHPVEGSLVAAVHEHDDLGAAAVEVDKISEQLLTVGVVGGALQLVEEEDDRSVPLLGQRQRQGEDLLRRQRAGLSGVPCTPDHEIGGHRSTGGEGARSG